MLSRLNYFLFKSSNKIEHIRKRGIGFWWMAFLYLVSEVGGVLLCITVRPEMYGIGASCAGFGLVGYYFSYLFTNFDFMARKVRGQRWCLFILVIVMILSNQGL